MNFYWRKNCRLCNSIDLLKVLELTPTPPANSLVSKTELDTKQDVYPLDVFRCQACGHLQLLGIVNPDLLFKKYVYVSSTSSVMVKYLEEQCQLIINRLGLKQGDLVVEIGSNDGTLLNFFKAKGMSVLGVDPASNILPDSNHIETIPEYFTENVVNEIIKKHGKAKLICAYNVCAHIDALSEVIDAVKVLLTSDGQFVFEVGYLLDVFKNNYFDTIYHEHLDFHHVIPLKPFFASHGLSLVHTERSNIQGGALVGYVGHEGSITDSTIEEMIKEEELNGLSNAKCFSEWSHKIYKNGEELKIFLNGLKSQGYKIVGYGAPAKATTLMYHFNLDSSLIDYIIDDNPIKQGLFTPGFHIPIYSEDRLISDRPDYILILAWNFAASIISKQSNVIKSNCRFIIPLPSLQVIG
jgi:hypothetical protein